MKQKPATGWANVMDLDDFETVASFFIDVAYLHLLENVQTGGVALFLGHTDPVWGAIHPGSIRPEAGPLGAN